MKYENMRPFIRYYDDMATTAGKESYNNLFSGTLFYQNLTCSKKLKIAVQIIGAFFIFTLTNNDNIFLMPLFKDTT